MGQWKANNQKTADTNARTAPSYAGGTGPVNRRPAPRPLSRDTEGRPIDRNEARGNSNGAPWAPVADLTLEEGTNWLGTGSGIDATGRVHRAVWLSE